MDLELSDDQLELRDSVRKVLESTCPPSFVRSVYEDGASADELWAQMVDLYWPAVALPESVGGLGLTFVELAIVAEELGRVTAPGPFLATATQFAPLVAEAGSPDQQQRFLAPVAEGAATGTVAYAEQGRYQLAAVQATATAVDGGWRIDGHKPAVIDGATATEIVVIARTPGSVGDDGIGVFVVAGTDVAAVPRLTIEPTVALADLTFDGVVVGADRVLVQPGEARAAQAVTRAWQQATIALAAATVGTCRRIFEVTLDYAKDRRYGRPIGSFQALKHRFADSYLAVERATALYYFAALTIAEDDDRRAEAAALAKSAAGDCQRLLVVEGLQLHGGIGFTWEHDLHFLLKRAKLGDALLGDATFHRAELAHILGITDDRGALVRSSGMKLSFSDEVEAFRAEFLTWLAENRPSAEEMESDPQLSSAHVPDWARKWTRRMFDAGWLVPGWPPELGGRNAGPIEQLAYMEELERVNIPRTTNPQGLGIVAPSILDYGTSEQIEEYAMPILRGERTACLGMSEPGAGSDLASLSTKAVLDGDRFIVNGQKVWTSGANYAEFCFLFCRTDATVAKHKGISILLVDMNTPGVTVRPLAEIIAPEHPDLNEVFFDEVEVPAANLVGELNNGWAMANGSLAHERGMVWLGSVMMLDGGVTRLLEKLPEWLAPLSDVERGAAIDRAMRVYTDVQAARALGYRGFAKLVRGGTAPEQALMKLFSSEIAQEMAQVGAELQGVDSFEQDRGGERWTDTGTWLQRYFQTFAGTISAGSSEIQRNIISERVLGLPRA